MPAGKAFAVCFLLLDGFSEFKTLFKGAISRDFDSLLCRHRIVQMFSPLPHRINFFFI
jgi:hypothetical protein